MNVSEVFTHCELRKQGPGYKDARYQKNNQPLSAKLCENKTANAARVRSRSKQLSRDSKLALSSL